MPSSHHCLKGKSNSRKVNRKKCSKAERKKVENQEGKKEGKKDTKKKQAPNAQLQVQKGQLLSGKVMEIDITV